MSLVREKKPRSRIRLLMASTSTQENNGLAFPTLTLHFIFGTEPSKFTSLYQLIRILGARKVFVFNSGFCRRFQPELLLNSPCQISYLGSQSRQHIIHGDDSEKVSMFIDYRETANAPATHKPHGI